MDWNVSGIWMRVCVRMSESVSWSVRVCEYGCEREWEIEGEGGSARGGVCVWLGGLPEPDRNGFAKQPSTFLGEHLISVRPVVVGAVVHAGHGGDGLWLGVRAERKATWHDLAKLPSVNIGCYEFLAQHIGSFWQNKALSHLVFPSSHPKCPLLQIFIKCCLICRPENYWSLPSLSSCIYSEFFS